MTKYTQDNNYFQKIDTERKAYWLGFLYADGCVTNQKSTGAGRALILNIHRDDSYLLEEFIKDLKSNRSIDIDGRGYARLSVSNKRLVEDLINLGCVPRKSLILKFPTEDIVPSKLINHFIRGYMDGDGCISVYKKKYKNRKTLINTCEIKFIGTYDMLYGIKKYFKSDKDVLINKYSPKSCQISFVGKKYRDIVDSLYNGATVYLTRKKLKWDEYVSYLDKREEEVVRNNNIKVVKFDMEANYIDTYKLVSLKEEFDISAIKKCCNNRDKYKSHKDFKWMYLSEYEAYLEKNIDIKDLISIRKRVSKKQNNKNINLKKYVKKEYAITKIEKSNFIKIRTSINIKNSIEKIKCSPIANKDNLYKSRAKIINQYSLDNQYIKTWESATEIAEFYNTTAKAIRKVCNGERKSCQGFIWKYRDKENVMNRENEQKAVNQYDFDGNYIKTWNSVKEVADYYNVTVQSIRRVCTGKSKYSCGFIWKHA